MWLEEDFKNREKIVIITKEVWKEVKFKSSGVKVVREAINKENIKELIQDII
jgi:homospermidine synthase